MKLNIVGINVEYTYTRNVKYRRHREWEIKSAIKKLFAGWVMRVLCVCVCVLCTVTTQNRFVHRHWIVFHSIEFINCSNDSIAQMMLTRIDNLFYRIYMCVCVFKHTRRLRERESPYKDQSPSPNRFWNSTYTKNKVRNAFLSIHKKREIIVCSCAI